MDFMFREEPSVHVGILTAPSVEADFLSPYTLTAHTPEGQTVTKQAVTGKQTVECRGNLLSWGGRCYTSLCFAPYRYAGACFRLPAVMIGIGFELHLSRSRLWRIAGVVFNRYLITAVLAWIFYHYLPFDVEIRKILVLIAFAPISALCAVFTAKCHGDVAMSCTVNSITIVLSIIIMTALMIYL